MRPSIAIPRQEWSVYIDGPALRGEVADYARRYFALENKDIVFRPMISAPIIGAVTKTFFYDALPVRGIDEDEDVFEARALRKSEELSRIGRQQNTHVCTGLTRHRSNRARRESQFEQKGVDVLLAVDVLRSAYTNVTDRYYIVTGDADFIPLIDQLIAMGKHVAIAYPRAVNDLLLEAADQAHPIQSFWQDCIVLPDSVRGDIPQINHAADYRPSFVKHQQEYEGIGLVKVGQEGLTWSIQAPRYASIGEARGTSLRAVIAAAEDAELITSDMGKDFRERYSV